MWLRLLKHLLPSGRAWRLTVDRNLRRFFEALGEALGPPAKAFIDRVWLDLFPQTTRELSAWERQWGLPDAGLTEQQRRDRLAGAWQALGGQSPEYIQQTLRAHGFDVYVHEWWTPGTEPALGVHGAAPPRSPILYLRREFTRNTSGVECGEALAECGEDFALAGNGTEPRGYPLVNKILETTPDQLPLCGEDFAEAGGELMTCGNYTGFRTDYRTYIVPSDTTTWAYFLYIGAEDINDIARVDPKRRDEFERLCLKICPTHLWLGILVEYV